MRGFRTIVLVTLFVLLAACGAPTTSTAPTNAPTTAAAAPAASPATPMPTVAATSAPTTVVTAVPTTGAAASSYPLTIENCGRTLTFAKAPERVVAVYQPLAEIMIALGLGEKIVGVQYGKAQDPLPEHAAAFNALPFLAAPGEGAAKEVIIATRPELVLASYFAYDLDPSNGAPSEADYQAIGAQADGMATDAPCLKPGQTFGMDAVYGDITTLGAIFGVPERAAALVAQMRGRIAAVQ
ncbi:MAG: ABC transporter substrate-binding protein, partial [Chloroflexales bacterium]|nr:ABC transporter substrate-binding protein [Chloroflexales bacterium]